MDILIPLGIAARLEVKNLWSAHSSVLQHGDLQAVEPGTYKTLRNGDNVTTLDKFLNLSVCQFFHV